MGEPAKNLQDIEPDIRPDLGLSVIQGGNQGDGSSTPERDSIKALEDMEDNPDKADSSNKSVAEKEDSGGKDNSWKDSTEPREYKDASGKTPKGMRVKKKKGPLGLILGLTFGSGGLIGMLFSPSLLIVQVKEMMVGKFNMQLTSMDMRTSKKIRAKIGGTTGGACGAVKILCKYKTMSPRQVANFDKAGIKVVASESNSLITDRIRPTSFDFKGNTISADDFAKTMKESVEFRGAVKNGYNPKYAGYSDSIWSKAAERLGLRKGKVKFDGDDAKAKTDDLKEKVNGKEAGDIDELRTRTDPETGDKYAVDKDGNDILGDDGEKIAVKEDGTPKDILDADDLDDALKQTDELVDELGEEGGEKAMKEAAEELAGGGVSNKILTKAGNIIKVTGYFDDACTVYNTVRAVGFAAKTVRVFQLTRYAMVFLRMADQIKGGGNPAPEDVAYLGDILTKEISGAGKVLVRSATESFGYKYAAYGDKVGMSNLSMQFLAGGGLTGDLIHLTSYFNIALFGKPKEVCRTLANPIVSIASLVGGVALLIGSGGTEKAFSTVLFEAGKTALKSAGTWISLGLVAANLILPALLKKIIAGELIDEGTIGEKAMEAIASGSSGLMAKTASFGGNGPLGYEQAAGYTKLGLEIQKQYAEEDRLAHSPFDISNSNTFMGNLLMKLTPYIVNMSKPTNILSSISSVVTNSMSIAFNGTTTKADSAEDYKKWCESDLDYKGERSSGGLALATDPYCNVIYGVPTEYLDKDPIEVAEELWYAEQITEDTGEPAEGSAYKKFITECIERTDPLGYAGKTGGGTDGKTCLWGEEFDGIDNSLFYLHHIDHRVENGMSGDDNVLNASTDFGYISFYDPIEDNDSNIALNSLITDIEKIDAAEEEVTKTFTSTLNRPTSTLESCMINNPEDRLLGLDILCGSSYIAPFKNKEYSI